MNYRELLQRQPVLPAPMCGISDFPFRDVCRQMGAEFTWTQMVSSEALIRGDEKTLEILDISEATPEPALGMQLFGAEPEKLAESCRILEQRGAAVLDLNMGCPAKKITCSKSGSALLRDLPLVREIFRAMRAATTVPLTVKMRWDWADDEEGSALEAAKIAEGEGLEAVCLHARTREQGYSGEANWELIGKLKQAIGIPVIGNGDVRSGADALEMMRQSGCDAVMIGRGAIGDPWLIGEALEAVRTGTARSERRVPTWDERRGMMLHHARKMAERKGEERGVVQFRKHAAQYLRGVPGGKKLRERLMHVKRLDELEVVLAADALEALVWDVFEEETRKNAH